MSINEETKMIKKKLKNCQPLDIRVENFSLYNICSLGVRL